MRDTSKLSSRTLLGISKLAMKKLEVLSELENIPKYLLVEKMINDYIPQNTTMKTGILKSVYMPEIRRVKKIFPYAIFINVSSNANNGTTLGLDYQYWLQYKNGTISWDQVKRLYVERLQRPDAQKRIEEIKKYLQSNDVYITSFECDEEFSTRKLFIDYFYGRLVWK